MSQSNIHNQSSSSNDQQQSHLKESIEEQSQKDTTNKTKIYPRFKLALVILFGTLTAIFLVCVLFCAIIGLVLREKITPLAARFVFRKILPSLIAILASNAVLFILSTWWYHQSNPQKLQKLSKLFNSPTDDTTTATSDKQEIV